jgi:cytochrome c peroxidase
MRRLRSLLFLTAASVAAACGGDASAPTTSSAGGTSGGTSGGTGGTPTPVTTPPGVLVQVAHQPATVGQPFTFDATLGGTAFSNPKGGALRYSATFAPNANGLSVAANGTVSGTPLVPLVTTVTLTATDTAGASVSQTFGVAAFQAGLALPTLTTTFQYTDAAIGLPAHFTALPAPGAPPGPFIAPTDNTGGNPVTDAGATLGRVLFYDKRLSANNTTSCASCHLQQVAFADTAQFSRGFLGGLTGRHSMALTNARWYRTGRFFWDERAATLEAQVLQPIQNAVEMGLSLADLKVKVATTSYYPGLFSAAFGTPEVNETRIATALAQFVRSMASFQSKYDRAFTTAAGGPPNFAGVLSADEEAGRQLFAGRAGCARCHVTDAQSLDQPRNDGLEAVTVDTGAGLGRFKSPSLRNVGLRSRFMHDGRFTTLAQVVNHYNSGIQDNPNLDPRLRAPNGQPQRLGLTPTEVAQLVSFMHALTDSTIVTAPRFKSPFGP